VDRKVKESVDSKEWKDELASNSESIVGFASLLDNRSLTRKQIKAERQEVKSSEEHIKELQKETAKTMKQASH
jgi:hypothetical protein